MIVLALDSSQIQASCCLIDTEKGILSAQTGSTSIAHSEALLSLVDKVLNGVSSDPVAFTSRKSSGRKSSGKNIDAFSVGVGPGSFTGIRIGCATIKAFSQVFKKPILPFSSLKALSFSSPKKLLSEVFVPAYQGQAFHGKWDLQTKNWSEDVISSPQSLERTFVSPQGIYNVIVHELATRGQNVFLDYNNLQANYMRASQAEIKLKNLI